MPIENFSNAQIPPIDRSESSFAAAQQLISENSVLANNPRVQKLAENDFVTEDGIELDPGNFLAKMLEFISMQDGGVISPEEVSQAVETVQHSLRPELESMIENRPN